MANLERLTKVRRMSKNGSAKALRCANDLSIRNVAAEVGVSPSTILRWETGQRVPRGPKAERYAEVLDRLGEAAR